MLTACFERQSEFMGCFLEMLSVDGSADADFDSWTECLNVRESGDAVVVDLALQQRKLLRLKGEATLTKVSLSRRYFAATSRATPPEVAFGSKLAFPAAYRQHSTQLEGSPEGD